MLIRKEWIKVLIRKRKESIKFSEFFQEMNLKKNKLEKQSASATGLDEETFRRIERLLVIFLIFRFFPVVFAKVFIITKLLLRGV